MLKVGNLFAGIGGIDLAFEQAGFEIAWANEIDTAACKTYRHNFPNTKLIEDDIRNLDAKVLAKAKHKTDPENYRGLGTRTDVKDRGRLAELFYFQAEKGSGITKELTTAAVAKYYAKLAMIEAEEAAKRV